MTKFTNAPTKRKKIAFLPIFRQILLYTIIILCVTNSAFGQVAIWQYVTTVTGGSKLYYKNDIKVLIRFCATWLAEFKSRMPASKF
jgi:hypothetical protein